VAQGYYIVSAFCSLVVVLLLEASPVTKHVSGLGARRRDDFAPAPDWRLEVGDGGGRRCGATTAGLQRACYA